ncbi:hypothetical protein ACA910_021798 [Epithemia clementina (nom. ined.)]
MTTNVTTTATAIERTTATTIESNNNEMSLLLLNTWSSLSLTTAISTNSSTSERNSHNKKNKNHDDDDDNDHASSSTRGIQIDILSVGSRHLPDQQAAQNDTFGSHPAVRYFYAATEADDVEVQCDVRLNPRLALQVARHCRRAVNHPNYPLLLSKLAERFIRPDKLKSKAHPGGWLCAQKRPLDAFLNMAQKYHYYDDDGDSKNDDKFRHMPDYLLILDDDAWVNLDHVVEYFASSSSALPNSSWTTNNPPRPRQLPRVVAGCLIVMNDSLQFTMPHGGFGLLWNREALQRLLQPLFCHHHNNHTTATATADAMNPNNPMAKNPASTRVQQPSSFNHDADEENVFEQWACWRLQQNSIGELPLFRNGMSIANLMQAYLHNQPYHQIRHWNNNSIGNCLHSDTAWGYFVNYYHLATQPPSNESPLVAAAPPAAAPPPAPENQSRRTRRRRRRQERLRRRQQGQQQEQQQQLEASLGLTNHSSVPTTIIQPSFSEGSISSDRLVGYNQSQMQLWGANKGDPNLWR